MLSYANTSVDYRDELFEVGGVQKSDVIHAPLKLLPNIFKVSCISLNASCADVAESVCCSRLLRLHTIQMDRRLSCLC